MSTDILVPVSIWMILTLYVAVCVVLGWLMGLIGHGLWLLYKKYH